MVKSSDHYNPQGDSERQTYGNWNNDNRVEQYDSA